MTAEELQMDDLYTGSKPQFLSEGNRPKSDVGASVEAEEGKCKKLKKPRRVLHFSDGTLEEYSTDEEEEKEKREPECMAVVDTKALTWGPWMYYWMLYTGSSVLAACDYVGESLANVLGITAPKYQYEIDEYHRSLEEEKQRKEEEDAEMAGWRPPGSNGSPVDAVHTSAVEHSPSPSHSLKQNLANAEVSRKNTNSVVPSVIVTAETEDSNDNSDSSQKASQEADSGDWERF